MAERKKVSKSTIQSLYTYAPIATKSKAKGKGKKKVVDDDDDEEEEGK